MSSARTSLTFLTVLLAPLLAPACGGTSSSGLASTGGDGGPGSGGAGATGTPLADLPGKLAPALCDVASTCLGPEFTIFLQGQPCTDQQTKSLEQSDFSLLQAAIDAHRVTYDGTKVQACVDALAQAGCDAFTKRLTTLCQGVVTGTVDAGGSCTLNAECKSGLFCQVASSCPGQCAPLLAAGGPCEKNDSCKDGLVCSDTTKKCIQQVSEGAACGATSGNECRANLVCAGSTATAAGTCKTITSAFTATEGAACDLQAATFCQEGLSCALTTVDQTSKAVFKCEKPATPPACHVPCPTPCHVGYPETCPTGQYCELPGNTVEGTCKPLPGDSQACTSHTPSDPNSRKDLCATATTCVSGTCNAIQDLGGACTTDAECVSKLCKSSHCVASDCADSTAK